MDSESERKKRALARAGWPVSLSKLGDEPADDLLATSTAAERVAMVWRLTQDAWAMGGRPLPDYLRSETPVRLVRKHERG